MAKFHWYSFWITVFILGVLLSTGNPESEEASDQSETQANQTGQLKLLKTFVSEFVEIRPGTKKFPKSFRMGSETGEKSERPVHTVTFDYDFSMSKYEVPQNLFEAVMGKNPSRWKGPRNSVEMVDWKTAREFCSRVTKLLRKAELIEPDEEIRLPTEAEWEYCCRAGTTESYSFGPKATGPKDEGKQASILDRYAWHTGNAAGNDPPVGALKPNPWGLYDMHGYLWEFVADNWHDDYQSAPADGRAWIDASSPEKRRVIRGGSWRDHYRNLRSAARKPIGPERQSDAVGFRCVKTNAKK